MKKILALASTAFLGSLPRLAAAQASMPQPLGHVTLEQIIGRVVQLLLSLAGTLALIMIIVAGFRWMTSQGEMEKVKKAKATLVWAIIGLIVTFSAYSVVSFIFTQL